MPESFSAISFRKSLRGCIAVGSRRLTARRITLTMAALIASTCALAQTVTTIYQFGSRSGDGTNPQAGVVFDKSGNLFGTTPVGGISGSNGVLFRLLPPIGGGVPWKERLLHKFKGQPADGKVPEGRVILTSSGRVFGTTLQGGTNNVGTAFVLRPPLKRGGPWTVKVLHSFGSSSGDGVNPNAGLLAANPGFYGVTFAGGTNGRGAVFQLTPASGGTWTETILYSFAADPDAGFPSSELVKDKSGNLYGTTTLGGANSLGAVYQLSPPTKSGGSWTETVIHSFIGTDGSSPAGRLQFDAKGTLYGTTDGGGAMQEGTVFQLTPPAKKGDPWPETVLYSFSGGQDGSNPQAGVIFGNKGTLVGTAASGGASSGGVVFQLTPPGGSGQWAETVLHSFSHLEGIRPVSQLIRRNGNMYGTTSLGGQFDGGTVFALTP